MQVDIDWPWPCQAFFITSTSTAFTQICSTTPDIIARFPVPAMQFVTIPFLLPDKIACLDPVLWLGLYRHFNWFANEKTTPTHTPPPPHTHAICLVFAASHCCCEKRNPTQKQRRAQTHTLTHARTPSNSYHFSFSLLQWRNIILSAHLFYSLHSLTWCYMSIQSYSHASLFWC